MTNDAILTKICSCHIFIEIKRSFKMKSSSVVYIFSHTRQRNKHDLLITKVAKILVTMTTFFYIIKIK